eukprot:m.139961 g.139961  ORF g.139961 m.139961 type:complete len:365 (-) comp9622_c0_seq6:90-1184(-)
MDEVVPRVFVSGLAAATYAALRRNGITRILSVGPKAEVELPDNFTHHKHVPLEDVPGADLLGILPECIAFIAAACEHKTARVLVHCAAGVSRSAAVVMAYIMASQRLPCAPAFRLLKTRHRSSHPNEGFVAQLKMFEAMGFCLDEEYAPYRLHRLQHLAESRYEQPIEPAALASAPQPGDAYACLIRCRVCRCPLAADRHVLEHEAGKGTVAFAWRRRDGGSSKCSSIFVEPMAWMAEVAEGLAAGKIVCPQCNGRIGSFDWAGAQCSCGAWITPAFQLHVSRTDVMPSRSAPARPPPAAPAAPPEDAGGLFGEGDLADLLAGLSEETDNLLTPPPDADGLSEPPLQTLTVSDPSTAEPATEPS